MAVYRQLALPLVATADNHQTRSIKPWSSHHTWNSPKATLSPEYPVGCLQSVFYQTCFRISLCPIQLLPRWESKDTSQRERLERKEWPCLGSLTGKTSFLFWSWRISLKDWLTYVLRDLNQSYVLGEGWEGNAQLEGAWSQSSKFSFSLLTGLISSY